MKLFLAMDLSDSVKLDIYQQIKNLRVTYPDIKWSQAENYHIPLFVFDHKVDEKKLITKIDNAVFDVSSFQLYSHTVDLMIRSNLILYLGFYKNPVLIDLVKSLKSNLGIVDELTFFPHITLGRYRIPSKQQYFLMKKKSQSTHVEIEVGVSQITLFKSVIENKIPHYRKIVDFPLLTEH